MTKLILGTVQFGMTYGISNKTGKPKREDVFEILDLAFQSGVRLLDTAEAYGDAQSLLGEYQRIRPGFGVLSKFKLQTEQDSIAVHLKKCLDDLGVSGLEGYSFHSVEQLLTFKHWNDLRELKSRGLVRHLGVSIYTNAEFERAIECEDIDLIQIPFNILDNYSLKGDLLLKARNKNKTIHLRSVYLQGLLFEEFSDFPTKLYPLKKYIAQLTEIAQNHNMTVAQMALLYAFSIQEIQGVIVGVETAEQLKTNLAFLNMKLPIAARAHIESVVCGIPELLNPCNWN